LYLCFKRLHGGGETGYSGLYGGKVGHDTVLLIRDHDVNPPRYLNEKAKGTNVKVLRF
jgi:hypothetical protein